MRMPSPVLWRVPRTRQRVRLFGLLVITLREQNHYSWATASISLPSGRTPSVSVPCLALAARH
jgi:hypothetical protein